MCEIDVPPGGDYIGNRRHSSTVVRYTQGLGGAGSRPGAACRKAARHMLWPDLRRLDMCCIGVVNIEHFGFFR